MNTMINRIEKLNELLQEEEFQLNYYESFKNNEKKAGIIINSKEYNCAPIVYIDHAIWSLSNQEVITFLKKIHEEHSKNVDTSSIINKDYILDNVLPRVYSKNNLEGMKKDGWFYSTMLDLVISYYVPLEHSNLKMNNGFVAITDSIMKEADLIEDELIQAADRNIEKIFQIESLNQLFSQFQDEYITEDLEPVMPMLVVSNSLKTFGAGVITNNVILEKIAEKIGMHFIILPSSIHELICIPYESEDKLAFSLEMVKTINAESLSLEDKLTDNVYIWNNGILNSLV